MITGFFWLVLWDQIKNKKEYDNKLETYLIVFDHIFPATALIVDWLLHSVPFAKRHVLITLGIGCLYIFLDFLTVKLIFNGEPVYPYVDYNNLYSLVALILLIITSVFFFITYYVN